jgi:hypothetical protein
MFDPQRCGQEILKIYRHILYGEPRPEEFDPKTIIGAGSVVNPGADISGGIASAPGC